VVPRCGPSISPPDGKTAYVAGHDSVIPLNLATRKLGKPIAVPGAGALAITPDGKTVYALGKDAGVVTPISTKTSKEERGSPSGRARTRSR
jgi:DNA-binding beta-propeller fold protein YncE